MATVDRIMKAHTVTVAASDTITTAALRMKTGGVGVVLVKEGARLSGILSERDIVERVLAEHKDPNHTKVSEVATPHPITVKSGTSIRDCIRLIHQHGFRHLPVLDGAGNLVGVLSSRDFLTSTAEGLARFLDEALASRKLQDDPYSYVVGAFYD